jgi:hypothetical protein
VPTEADGGPVAVVATGANVRDSLLLPPPDALAAVIVEPPNPHAGPTQHLCLDEAFGGAPSDATARVLGYAAPCRQICEGKKDAAGRGRRGRPGGVFDYRRW